MEHRYQFLLKSPKKSLLTKILTSHWRFAKQTKSPAAGFVGRYGSVDGCSEGRDAEEQV